MIDDIDIQILVHLRNFPNSTTTEIATRMFKPRDRQETIKRDAGVRWKLEKLRGLQLVEKCGDGKARYHLNGDGVFLGGGRFHIPMKGGKKVIVDIDDFLALRDGDGNFYIYRLSPALVPM